MKTEIDKRKLTIEQHALLEQYNMSKQQLKVISDSADMLQEVINLLSDTSKTKQLGAVLVDIRESLAAIKDKETPEPLDQATPVVEAVRKLAAAVENRKAPVVKVDSPSVNVPAPQVTVDLKEVNKTLKGLKHEPMMAISDEVSTLYAGNTAIKPKFAPIDSMQPGQTIVVHAKKNKKIRVLACFLMAGDTTDVRLLSGGIRPLTGLIQLVPSTGFVLGYNQVGWGESEADESLVIEQSQNAIVGGLLTYIEV